MIAIFEWDQQRIHSNDGWMDGWMMEIILFFENNQGMGNHESQLSGGNPKSKRVLRREIKD